MTDDNEPEDPVDKEIIEDLDLVEERPNLWQEPDRKRGILTKNDREFLLGEKSLEGQNELNTRYRIRQRVIQALLDIQFLVHYLDRGDMRQIANDDRIDERISESVGTLAYDLIHNNDDVVDPIDTFEDRIASAVLERKKPQQMSDDDSKTVRVYGNVDIEVGEEIIDIEEIAKDLAESIIEDESDREEFARFLEHLADSKEGIGHYRFSETDDS